MPTASLQKWQTERDHRIGKIYAQCAIVAAQTPPDVDLVDENFVPLPRFSVHIFKGFAAIGTRKQAK